MMSRKPIDDSPLGRFSVVTSQYHLTKTLLTSSFWNPCNSHDPVLNLSISGFCPKTCSLVPSSDNHHHLLLFFFLLLPQKIVSKL